MDGKKGCDFKTAIQVPEGLEQKKTFEVIQNWINFSRNFTRDIFGWCAKRFLLPAHKTSTC